MARVVEQLEGTGDPSAAHGLEHVAEAVEEARAVDREDEQETARSEQAARLCNNGARVENVLEEVPHRDGIERRRRERRREEVALPDVERERLVRVRGVTRRELDPVHVPPGGTHVPPTVKGTHSTRAAEVKLVSPAPPMIPPMTTAGERRTPPLGAR